VGDFHAPRITDFAGDIMVGRLFKIVDMLQEQGEIPHDPDGAGLALEPPVLAQVQGKPLKHGRNGRKGVLGDSLFRPGLAPKPSIAALALHSSPKESPHPIIRE